MFHLLLDQAFLIDGGIFKKALKATGKDFLFKMLASNLNFSLTMTLKDAQNFTILLPLLTQRYFYRRWSASVLFLKCNPSMCAWPYTHIKNNLAKFVSFRSMWNGRGQVFALDVPLSAFQMPRHALSGQRPSQRTKNMEVPKLWWFPKGNLSHTRRF